MKIHVAQITRSFCTAAAAAATIGAPVPGSGSVLIGSVI